MQSLGYIYRPDHAHEATLINTKGGGGGGGEGGGGGGRGGGRGGGGDIFCGGGTKSASRICPPGQNPLADFVRRDRIS